ncbi:MAG: 3-dehydroquinate synthase family protein [Planctomycetota bacterium]|nr:3-dehydroquinate synthase family protein [Planctomycetota bacterium]
MSEPAMERRVSVALASAAYEVVVAPGLLDRLGELVRGVVSVAAKRAFVAYDDQLPPAMVAKACASLAAAGFVLTREPLRADEQEKSLASVDRLLHALLASRHERLDPVVALGGGIVGDVAGFAAAIYRRGVPLVQCPTTLLAMVDASVGGKTGVNLTLDDSGETTLKKNMVGSFHQPVLVLADVRALASLPRREFAAGLAECIKHACLAGEFGEPNLLEWTEAKLRARAASDAGFSEATLVELIARNVGVKARVVGLDEREMASDEAGGRALLNLGHTFAHAIETRAGVAPCDEVGRPLHPPPLTHGEAVALGLVAASVLSESLGLIDEAQGVRVRELLALAGLPVRASGLPDAATIRGSMMHDKKVLGGQLRLIVRASPTTARIVRTVSTEEVDRAIHAIS